MLLEQTRHVGGLSTSGLNRDECNHLDRPTLGGLCEQFLEEAVKRSDGRWTEGSSRTWQSGIAERVFLEMLEGSRCGGAIRAAARIRSRKTARESPSFAFRAARATGRRSSSTPPTKAT